MFKHNLKDTVWTLYEKDNIANDLRRGSLWESHITKFMTMYLKPDYNCIDIGANFGYHTVSMSRLCPDGIIYAFEPQRENFILLMINANNNQLNNTLLFNEACGERHEIVRMPILNVESGPWTINMGNISVNKDSYGKYLTSEFHIVECTRLDDKTLNRIDFIKIDVQGYELFVINGMTNLLMIDKPVIIVELETDQLTRLFNVTCADVVNRLRSLGYEIFYLEYDYPSDHVCVHQDQLETFRQQFQSFIPTIMTLTPIIASGWE